MLMRHYVMIVHQYVIMIFQIMIVHYVIIILHDVILVPQYVTMVVYYAMMILCCYTAIFQYMVQDGSKNFYWGVLALISKKRRGIRWNILGKRVNERSWRNIQLFLSFLLFDGCCFFFNCFFNSENVKRGCNHHHLFNIRFFPYTLTFHFTLLYMMITDLLHIYLIPRSVSVLIHVVWLGRNSCLDVGSIWSRWLSYRPWRYHTGNWPMKMNLVDCSSIYFTQVFFSLLKFFHFYLFDFHHLCKYVK